MSKKYHTAARSTIVTNDLFMAAFLHCVGCNLDHVERNDRRRVSFVFIGERVRELREAYRTGPVRLDMNLFRDSLYQIRRTMDGVLTEERSDSHGSTRLTTGVQTRERCYQTHPNR
jgi:hypothetical protein